jgi:hypothetical protein
MLDVMIGLFDDLCQPVVRILGTDHRPIPADGCRERRAY